MCTGKWKTQVDSKYLLNISFTLRSIFHNYIITDLTSGFWHRQERCSELPCTQAGWTNGVQMRGFTKSSFSLCASIVWKMIICSPGLINLRIYFGIINLQETRKESGEMSFTQLWMFLWMNECFYVAANIWACYVDEGWIYRQQRPCTVPEQCSSYCITYLGIMGDNKMYMSC